MIRTQIQLNQEQYRRIREMARERGVSMAEVVRQGVDLALSQFERGKAWERARAVIGRYRSGVGDVAPRHDAYLSEAYRK